MSKKILIIDDEDDIIIFLETLFKSAGYETITARNGIEALDVAKREKPDLMTLDLQMPKNTGTDFYRKVSREADLKDVPVVVVSGVPGRHLAVPKPAAVFEKPIDREKLLATVQDLIE
ncbi:response regulator [candidate division GN15 bacterium]|nr:response regulator [candidate division GN15 bacterium]